MNTGTTGAHRDPRTKEELLNRLMSRDFTGDISDLAEGRNLRIERIRPHILRLTFLITGQKFDLVVKRPRLEETSPARRPSKAGGSEAPEPKPSEGGESKPRATGRNRTRAGPKKRAA